MTLLINLLLLALDANHCARWQDTPWGIKCAEARLNAPCVVRGWHVIAQGLSVCVRDCGDERPTT